MTKDAKYSLIALASSVPALTLLLWMTFENWNWAKWFGFVMWTGLVFGGVLYFYAKSVDTIERCFWLFHSMLAVHIIASIFCLRSIGSSPKTLFFWAPRETALVGAVLALSGGARSERRREQETKVRLAASPRA